MITKTADKSYRMVCKATTQEGEDGRTITSVIASTATSDRSNDIVEQDWSLENFNANPVALFNHSTMMGVVGRVVRAEVVAEQLEADILWDEADDNPLGQKVARQFREGFLNAVSVGFRAGQVIWRMDLDESDPKHATRGLWLSHNELLEISAVPVPANPQALSKADDAPITRGELRGLVLGLLREDVEIKAVLEALTDEPAEPDWWVDDKSAGGDWFDDGKVVELPRG